MKPTFIALLATFGFAAASLASTVEDADGDGGFSMDEMLVAYPDLTGDTFLQIDADGDALVSEEELAAAIAAGLIAG